MFPVAKQQGTAASFPSLTSWFARLKGRYFCNELLHSNRLFKGCYALTPKIQFTTTFLPLYHESTFSRSYLSISDFQYSKETPGANERAFSH